MTQNQYELGTVLSASSVCTTDDTILQLGVVEALDRHKVIVIRNCQLSIEGFSNLGAQLGRPQPHTLRGFSEPGHPDVMILSNLKNKDGKPLGLSDAGRIWHSDSAFTDTPPSYTLLHSVSVPSKGGETLFIDMENRYNWLPANLRKIVDGHRGIFSYKPSYEAKRKLNPNRRALTKEEEADLKEVFHPLALRHPNTGKTALYTSESHCIGVENLSPDESKKTLAALYTHCYAAGPDYIHQWQENDVLIWDNRSVIHCATPYAMDEARYIRRLTLVS